MRHVLDMLDLIKAKVENSQVATIVKALNSRDEVIVEIEFFQLLSNTCGEFNTRDLVLSKS